MYNALACFVCARSIVSIKIFDRSICGHQHGEWETIFMGLSGRRLSPSRIPFLLPSACYVAVTFIIGRLQTPLYCVKYVYLYWLSLTLAGLMQVTMFGRRGREVWA